jgi:hypothetical protein
VSYLNLKLYDVSEAGYASVIRYKNGKDPIQLGPLDRTNLYHIFFLKSCREFLNLIFAYGKFP